MNFFFQIFDKDNFLKRNSCWRLWETLENQPIWQKFDKKWTNALFELPLTNFLDWKSDFWYWFSHYIPNYVCIYLKTAQLHSERKIFFRSQNTILIFCNDCFWKYLCKKKDSSAFGIFGIIFNFRACSWQNL